MQEIIACDVNGNSITDLVQWDNHVNLYFSDTGITGAYSVRFFNNTMDEALVCSSTFDANKLKVEVPNILLTQSYMIFGYIVVPSGDTTQSLYAFKLNVRKQPKPSNLVYEDSDDYITLEGILDECKDYANQASQSASSASGYADAAEDSADESEKWAGTSQSWAVGTGDDTRGDQETNNSKYYSEQSAESARSAKEYSGKPPIIQKSDNGFLTWWTWDAEGQNYVDTHQIAVSTVYYATFLLKEETGDLYMYYDKSYQGPNFQITDDGDLQVIFNVPAVE